MPSTCASPPPCRSRARVSSRGVLVCALGPALQARPVAVDGCHGHAHCCRPAAAGLGCLPKRARGGPDVRTEPSAACAPGYCHREEYAICLLWRSVSGMYLAWLARLLRCTCIAAAERTRISGAPEMPGESVGLTWERGLALSLVATASMGKSKVSILACVDFMCMPAFEALVRLPN